VRTNGSSEGNGKRQGTREDPQDIEIYNRRLRTKKGLWKEKKGKSPVKRSVRGFSEEKWGRPSTTSEAWRKKGGGHGGEAYDVLSSQQGPKGSEKIRGKEKKGRKRAHMYKKKAALGGASRIIRKSKT